MASTDEVQMDHASDDSPLSELESSPSVNGSPSTIASSVRSTRRHKVINYSELNSGRANYNNHEDDDHEMDQSEDEHEDESEEEEEQAPRPARKKAKTTKAKTPAKKKKNTSTTNPNKKAVLRGNAKVHFQQAFQNAPVDVVREIATHLDLKTLLALTRTCRVTRSLVLDPGSASIWKTVMKRDKVPELDSKELKDVELARLVYDRQCHVCGKGKANKVDFTLMKRACAKCWRSNAKFSGHGTTYHPRTLECIPVSDGGDYSYYTIHWVPEAVKMSNKLKELDLESAEGKKFVEERKELARKIAADGRRLSMWLNSVNSQKEYQARMDVSNRRQDLVGRLRSLGYEQKYLYRNELTGHRHFKSKAELTDASFAKISPELTSILDGLVAKDEATKSATQATAQANKLKDDYTALKKKHQSKIGLFPPFGDYLDLPSIKPLWSVDKKAKSKGKQTEDDHQAQILIEITALAESIRNTVYDKLVDAHAKAELLPGGASRAGFDVEAAKEDADKSLMSKVTSAIACPRVGCPVWNTFPDILDHACSDHILRGSFENVGEYKLADNPLETSPEKVAVIRTVLAAAGEREKTSGVETLDELDWKLTCKDCPKAHELMTKPPPKPKPAVEVPAPPAPVVGPLDKFLIKKEDGPKFIKPKSETSVQPEDEGEPPICYDWRELIYHASHNRSHGYALEAKFAKLELDVLDEPGPKPVARPSRFLDPTKENTSRGGRGAAAFLEEVYDGERSGPHGEGCMCCDSGGEYDSEMGTDYDDGATYRLALANRRGGESDDEDDDVSGQDEARAAVKLEDEEMEMGDGDDDTEDEAAEEAMKSRGRVVESNDDDE